MTTQGASATRDDDDVRIAQLCLDLGKAREARTILTRVIAAGDDTPTTALLMAQACFATRATREGLDFARRAVGRDPENAWGWRLLAANAAANRDHDIAFAAVLRAIELDPDNWRTHAERVEVDMACKRAHEDTWDSAQRAVELAGDEAGPFLTSARLARYNGHLDGAKMFYREALKRDPGNSEATHGIARARLDSNDMAGATVAFSDMLARNPRSRSASRSLRRAVLRTLEWVTGILLVGLIVVGMLAILGDVDHGAAVVKALLAVTLALILAGLVFAFDRYRRGLGEGGPEFLRSLPRLSPGLMVLAALQALVLVCGILLVVTLIAGHGGGGLGLTTAVAAIGASGGIVACLLYTGVFRAAL
ncbi:tetratricopeptide repeat protein [Frondihabitans australicus]|uniref:Tetratricopeptide repeat protein n=1 Tax=Frondihabitans australicus TaxID=386892 RepID=A0A495IE94_9MICO|nr:tetratricopeptide repeat protein [Frondihabitans australicus]RKR74099.1 tetratricopeptide repeat protein [Frondihabitans australicus]